MHVAIVVLPILCTAYQRVRRLPPTTECVYEAANLFIHNDTCPASFPRKFAGGDVCLHMPLFRQRVCEAWEEPSGNLLNSILQMLVVVETQSAVAYAAVRQNGPLAFCLFYFTLLAFLIKLILLCSSFFKNSGTIVDIYPSLSIPPIPPLPQMLPPPELKLAKSVIEEMKDLERFQSETLIQQQASLLRQLQSALNNS